jgi:hypothetical protein
MNELNIKLTVEDINLILASLGKLPLEASIGVFGKVKAQAESQINPVQTPPSDE